MQDNVGNVLEALSAGNPRRKVINQYLSYQLADLAGSPIIWIWLTLKGS